MSKKITKQQKKQVRGGVGGIFDPPKLPNPRGPQNPMPL